jgi:thioredoxin 1
MSEEDTAVVKIHSEEEFDKLIASGSKEVAVIDFTATWCPPCRMIAPEFDKLSKTEELGSKVAFLKVDVDECGDLASRFEVDAMPSFIVLRNGTEVDRLLGADLDGLRTMLEKHATGK